ncbi:MAG: tRNA 2-thiouridine(34) synthase MnmA [Anaerolineales bacterium]|nr:tRNA 2-thiouridine(34) synthase MnmA [Anaerolineales bacterium]MDW8447307.1 tRNA 2-thiouridine(34) synthase MnmA [Anaerolineales bacterium]
MNPSSKIVVVGMSGGVDSSVAAALLKEEGYRVIGVMMNLWSESGKENANRCCTPDSMRVAKRVAAVLDIPFYTLDVREQFYNRVVSFFIEGYQQGITPNPCIQCNRYIRWGALLDFALSLGAAYLATGHYARKVLDEHGKYQLLRAKDQKKDQSYVLHLLTQADLARTLFPLGELTKEEVRQLAIKFRLPVAHRNESQDLCFLAGEDYRDFLRRHLEELPPPGPILDTQGNYLGQHGGLPFYTIGQRKGLGISTGKPTYVVSKDVARQALIVGSKEETRKSAFTVARVNWISGFPPPLPAEATVKVRYLSPLLPARIHPAENDCYQVTLAEPYSDITPGQAAVFYQGELCLGGGTIHRVLS